MPHALNYSTWTKQMIFMCFKTKKMEKNDNEQHTCAYIIFTHRHYLYSELDELSNIRSFNVEGFCASWVELEGW